MTDAPGLREISRNGPVHFMGAGGAGMSALVELLLRKGREVTGCDLKRSETVERLEALGARIHEGHDPGHLEGASALVVSSAVPGDHPELRAARERGLPVMKRARALGSWVNRARVVAVAGTHGKTTTTAMATEILAAAGEDPTGFVGGTVPRWESNLRRGGDTLFVVEADEYDRSFHELEAEVAVVTNLEADHLDVYGSFEEIREAFHRFCRGVSPEGRVTACADDPGASSLLAALGGRAHSYGLNPGAELRAVDVRLEGGRPRFQVWEEGRDRGEIRLEVPGLHSVRNALGAAAASRHLGVEWRAVREGLANFSGVARRFQLMGERGGVAVVDDYAHHPTEIEATLQAARDAFPDRRIVAVFQPHLYSRTRDFAGAFGRALAGADRIWVTDVFPAREEPIAGISGRTVVDAVREAGGGPVEYGADLGKLEASLSGELEPGDVCVLMGAGSIGEAAPGLLRRLGGEAGE